MDPISADRIHPNNIRRVIRALEVQMVSGKPISELQRMRPPPWRIFRLGLNLPRSILYPRVDRRVDDMIAAGFVDEVRGLLDMGYERDLPVNEWAGLFGNRRASPRRSAAGASCRAHEVQHA